MTMDLNNVLSVEELIKVKWGFGEQLASVRGRLMDHEVYEGFHNCFIKLKMGSDKCEISPSGIVTRYQCEKILVPNFDFARGFGNDILLTVSGNDHNIREYSFLR